MLSREIFENVTLVACWRKHLRDFLAILLVAELPAKEVFQYTRINSLASFQRYRHGVKSCALTCPWKCKIHTSGWAIFWLLLWISRVYARSRAFLCMLLSSEFVLLSLLFFLEVVLLFACPFIGIDMISCTLFWKSWGFIRVSTNVCGSIITFGDVLGGKITNSILSRPSICACVPTHVVTYHHIHVTWDKEDMHTSMFFRIFSVGVGGISVCVVARKLFYSNILLVRGADLTWCFPFLPSARVCGTILCSIDTGLCRFSAINDSFQWNASQND